MQAADRWRNENSSEKYSNSPNWNANSDINDLNLPKDWESLPTNDIENPKTGEKTKGLKTLLNENYKQIISNGNSRSSVQARKAREALRRELDLRNRKYEEWRKVYNISEKGQITLDDLSRLFYDNNSNKILDALFDKVESFNELFPNVVLRLMGFSGTILTQRLLT